MTDRRKQKSELDMGVSKDKRQKIIECRFLSAKVKEKLAYYDVVTLQDLSERISRSQLLNMRGVGEKTLLQLEECLAEAGLSLLEHHRFVEPSQQQLIQGVQQQYQSLIEQTEAWVKENKPDCWQAKQSHSPGSFSLFIKAQIQALESIEADATIKREFEHQLVKSMNRYEKQKRYAVGREALKEGITTRARKPRRGK